MSQPQQQQQDVPQDQLCLPNKCFDLMDTNKKFDLLNPKCRNESKILANILLNHPLRLSIAMHQYHGSICISSGILCKKMDKGLHYSLMHHAKVIPYPRFTKIIVDYYMTKHADISQRIHDNYHRVKNDDLVKNIFNSGKNKDGAGMNIPDWMLTADMKLTDHYKMHNAIFRVDVPTTQSQPIKSTQGTHRTPSPPRSPNPINTEGESTVEIDVTNLHETIQISIATQRSLQDFKAKQNVEMVQEHIVDEELEKLLDGNDNVNVDEFMNDIFNNQEDPGTRVEPRSDKEIPEVEIDADLVPVNSNEEEEESAEEMLIKRRREKGKGIEESRSSPPPRPIRSPRTHIAPLSTDKEKLQELTTITDDASLSTAKEKLQELTVTDPTPSSSTPSSSLPKPKTGKRQDNVVAMIVEAIQKERKNLRTEVISHFNDVVANHIPP
ncbi:hypothetical protein Tco_0425060 [Tanacetum coccineum]